MTIIDFYKNLSKILTDTREEFLTEEEGQSKLDNLLKEAKTFNLNVNIDPKILDSVNLCRLDDERSFRKDEDYDSDYDMGSDFSYY